MGARPHAPWIITNGVDAQDAEKTASELADKLPLNGVINTTSSSGSVNASIASPILSSPRGGGVRRAHNIRFANGVRIGSGSEEMDLEEGSIEKEIEKPSRERQFVKSRHQALISGVAYCISSCSMILLNKYVLSGFNLDAGISLMFYQNLVSVLVVYSLSCLGVIHTERLSWKLVRVWFPVNLIFVGMLVSSIYRYIDMDDNAHFEVHERCNGDNIKECYKSYYRFGEMYLFSKHHNRKVWGSLFLMVVSAICGGITDLSFHGVGYSWQIANCFLTAAYSLTLRKVMDLAKQATKSGSLNEFSMVLLNNSLSLPLGAILLVFFREIDYLSASPMIKLPVFWVVTTFSGLFGLAISFTSMWFLHQTSPTTYSLVGSLNKIPISLAGILLFSVPTSLSNLCSILFGLFAGVVFAKAKMSSNKA